MFPDSLNLGYAIIIYNLDTPTVTGGVACDKTIVIVTKPNDAYKFYVLDFFINNPSR